MVVPYNEARQWDRYGRGHRVVIYATAEEILDVLLTKLPPEYAPYGIVGYELVRPEGQKCYTQVPFTGEITDLVALSRQPGDCFLRSLVLNPVVNAQAGDDLHAAFFFNGLICVRLRHLRRGSLEAADISIVNRIINVDTCEVVEYQAYYTIFRTIKRRLKALECYPVMGRDEQGLYDTGKRATEGIARQLAAGEISGLTLGERLVKKPRSRVKR